MAELTPRTGEFSSYYCMGVTDVELFTSTRHSTKGRITSFIECTDDNSRGTRRYAIPETFFVILYLTRCSGKPDGGEARVRTSAQEPRVIHDITPPNFQEPAVMTPSAFAPRVRTSTTVYRPPTPVQSYLFLADTGSSSLGSPQEDGPGARLYRGFERCATIYSIQSIRAC